MRVRAILSGLLILASSVSLQAQTALSTSFTYQGQLKTNSSLANGLHDLRFRLYNDTVQVGATLCKDNVSVNDGLFSVSLDFGTQFVGQKRFLEIEVRADTGLDCTNATGYTTLTPRQELTASPNAIYATTAASSTTAGDASLLNGQPASFYQNAGNLTAGTLPSARLSGTYSSAMTLSSGSNSFTGNGAGLTNLNAGSISSGSLSVSRLPYPLAISGNSGVDASIQATTTSGSGTGISATASSSSGTTYGVQGINFSTGSGVGVFGSCVPSSGFSTGVWGKTNSSDGTGVYGQASAGTGNTIGVHGESASPAGAAGYFNATASSGATLGVYASAVSDSGKAVWGWAPHSTGSVYGVYGQASSTSGYGVYALGRSGASGTKSFRIDHPDDPENKYLLHYSAESPDVINFYSGTAQLDAAGEAVVTLPTYFAKINRDPRYGLTAVGVPMPMLHIADEIDSAALAAGILSGPGVAAPTCSFRIAGGAANARVSWEVKAVRNDLWMQAYGAPVEVDKQGAERGTYQYPEFYNQPEDRAIDDRAIMTHAGQVSPNLEASLN